MRRAVSAEAARLAQRSSVPLVSLYAAVAGGVHGREVRVGDDVWRVENHLHYDGTYHPPVKTMTSATPVDWVVPGLPAHELGYK